MSEPQRDPAGWDARLDQYSEALRVRAFSEITIRMARCYVGQLARWCEERGVLRPSEVTRNILERYQRHVFYMVNPRTQKHYALAGQLSRLSAIRAFFKWLVRQHLVLYNAAADIELPRPDRTIPRRVLSAQEADKVLTQPDTRTLEGLRDRAILETFYSSGVRRSELLNLDVDDVDLERGVAVIRLGKGRKDRMVPLGARACEWIRLYVYEGRLRLVSGRTGKELFLTRLGARMSKTFVTHMVKTYLESSGVGKGGACHLFRHTCATLMLEGGADIRYIQVLLGHSSLDSTQIYTRVAITKLKEIHTLTHPGANLHPKADSSISKPPEKSA